MNHELKICINPHMYYHTIWCPICSYPLNLHGKCKFDPRNDLKGKFHSFSHSLEGQNCWGLLFDPEMPHNSDSLCLSKSEWHIEVVANPNVKDPMFLPSHSTLWPQVLWDWELTVMPCPVMNCPLKAGRCWASSVPLPLEYPGKIIASWCIVHWKAARVSFV